MRKVIAVLVLFSSISAYLLMNRSVSSEQTPLPQAAGKYPVFVRAVEREIRKHERWVEEEVEQDYTTAPHRRVTLRLLNKKYLEQMSHEGFITFVAAYRENDDILIIPYPGDADVLDSIDHELWHAIFDHEGKVGLTRRPEYSGPTPDDIAAYTKKKVGSPEFRAVAESIAAAQTLVLCGKTLEGLYHQGERVLKAAKRIQEVDQLCRSKHELERYLGVGESREVFLKAVGQYKNKIYGLYGHVHQVAALWKEFQQAQKRMRARELALLVQKLVVEDEALRTVRAVITEVRALHMRVAHAYEEAEKKKRAEDFRDADPRIKEAVRGFDALELPSSRALEYFQDSMEDLDGMVSYILTDLKASANADTIEKTFGDPNEVMGRVIDSLYTLYLGSVEQNHFPLGERDLAFLDGFTWRGEKLFRKGIEKYRVGLSMLRDGIPAAEVKRRLEYATAFEYGGTVYSWPEANFRVKGVIPIASSLPGLAAR